MYPSISLLLLNILILNFNCRYIFGQSTYIAVCSEINDFTISRILALKTFNVISGGETSQQCSLDRRVTNKSSRLLKGDNVSVDPGISKFCVVCSSYHDVAR